MRQFIRHPVDIPIEVASTDQTVRAEPHLLNVSLGGLAFQSDVEFAAGLIVEVRIPLVRPMFETRARVVWCRARDGRHQLGVEFLDPEDAFRVRMVEQICHIEDYKNMVHRSEGRLLSMEEAAQEWIDKFAAHFPYANPDDK
jgi:hypothetical protein